MAETSDQPFMLNQSILNINKRLDDINENIISISGRVSNIEDRVGKIEAADIHKIQNIASSGWSATSHDAMCPQPRNRQHFSNFTDVSTVNTGYFDGPGDSIALAGISTIVKGVNLPLSKYFSDV